MLLLPFVVGTVRGIQDAGFRPVTVALGALWLVGYLAYFLAATTARSWALAGRPLSPRTVGMGEIVATLTLLAVALVLE